MLRLFQRNAAMSVDEFAWRSGAQRLSAPPFTPKHRLRSSICSLFLSRELGESEWVALLYVEDAHSPIAPVYRRGPDRSSWAMGVNIGRLRVRQSLPRPGIFD